MSFSLKIRLYWANIRLTGIWLGAVHSAFLFIRDEFYTPELQSKESSIYLKINLTDFQDENTLIYFLSLHDLSVKGMSP